MQEVVEAEAEQLRGARARQAALPNLVESPQQAQPLNQLVGRFSVGAGGRSRVAVTVIAHSIAVRAGRGDEKVLVDFELHSPTTRSSMIRLRASAAAYATAAETSSRVNDG